MKKSRLLGAMCASVISFITASSHGELFDRGGGLIYDDVLDITWAQPDTTYVDPAQLTLGGVSGWRLPYISVTAGKGAPRGISSPVDCSTATELACRDNELGYMFYHNLSGTRGQPILTSGDPDLALFPTPLSRYQSGTQYSPLLIDLCARAYCAWDFDFDNGLQSGVFHADTYPNVTRFNSWAVHAGDVQGNPDADGDGVNDDEDLCPETAPEAAVDAVGCSDTQVDGDGDGVCNDGAVSSGPSTCVGTDACPETVIPEGVPTVTLGTNRWALVDDDFEFDTTAPNGKGPGRSYSTADTGGCSCEQIIGALGLGTGQEKYGCSIGTMDGWVVLPMGTFALRLN